MIWITGIAAFLVGAGTGALLYKLLRSDEARVKALESKLQELSEEHENYKSSVHSHFNGTARLLNEMTDSYRNVYQHLAKGAQNLCPDYISSQLSLENLGRPSLPQDDIASAAVGQAHTDTEPEPSPPLDYAARRDAAPSSKDEGAPDERATGSPGEKAEGSERRSERRIGALDEDYGISRPGERS